MQAGAYFTLVCIAWGLKGGMKRQDFPVTQLAAALSRCEMTVKRSLNELESAGLIMRVRRGAGELNRIYILIPKKRADKL